MKVVLITSRSITIELLSNTCYYYHGHYDVYLNDTLVLKEENKNVISLFSLTPNTKYKLKILDETINFQTKKENSTLYLKDFYAVGDGVHDDTPAFNAALSVASSGTTIIVEKGTYLVSPIFLKSEVNLYLEKDAIILGQTDRVKYPILPAQKTYNGKLVELNSWEGSPDKTFASLITGIEVHDVIIYGEGIIDENAQNSDWWVNHKEIRIAARPKGVFLSNCRDITLQGITVKNTPSWNIHPYFSRGINLININLINPKKSPNTDGFDPESCSDILVLGVLFSVGDDCIAIKSGKFDMGMKYQEPTQRMTIRNCYMRDGHGAVVLGSEMSGGIRDLDIKQCLFEDTDRGLRIKTRRGRGKYGIIDNITFDNIVMKNVLTPFVINMFYFCDDDGKTEYVYSKKPLPVDDRTPYLGRFYFKNIVATDVSVAAGYFYGLPEQKVRSITLENIKITYSEKPTLFHAAMMSFLEPFTLHGFEFRNVSHVFLKNIDIQKTKEETFVYEGVDKIINE
jgi:polygalacturonase